MLGAFAIGVLAIGVYPKPLTDSDGQLRCSELVQQPDRWRRHEIDHDRIQCHTISRTMLPELFLLGATCAILLVDLFLKPTQRGVTHWLSVLALVVTACLLWRGALPRGHGLRVQRHVPARRHGD